MDLAPKHGRLPSILETGTNFPGQNRFPSGTLALKSVNGVPHRERNTPLECGRWTRQKYKALICSKSRAAPFQDGFRATKRARSSDSRFVVSSKNVFFCGSNITLSLPVTHVAILARSSPRSTDCRFHNM